MQKSLEQYGIRVETDLRNEKIGFKIREAQMNKIPYMLVIGDKEIEQGLVAVRSRQKLSELAMDLQGNLGLHFDPHAYVKEDWGASWLNAPTGRIAGGSDEVLLNTIAERILGLPQDHRPDKGVPFNQIPA